MDKFVSEMRSLAEHIDMDFVMRETKALYEIERGQTFECRRASSDYIEALLRREGFPTERIPLKADGFTTYQDKRMPIGWDISNAKLTLLSDVAGIADPVIADYKKNPLSVVWGTTSTKEGGIKVRIINESDVYAGEDARGALVFLGNKTRACSETVAPLLDLGAIGFVTDLLVGGDDTPDCNVWVNSATDGGNNWHVQGEDRDFIAFSITTRVGRALRAAVSSAHVYAHIESDGVRHESEIAIVSATVKGESERELWVMAHLYEPLATDNSTGVIGSVAIAKLLRELSERGEIKLKYTIRLVFTMELYGFAAAAEHFGGYLGDRVIGGVNIDGMPITPKNKKIKLYTTPYSTPFMGNHIMTTALQVLELAFPEELKFTTRATSTSDDCSLVDPTVMLPTVWAVHDVDPTCHYHHNSVRDFEYISIDKYRAYLAAIAFFAEKCIAPEESDIAKLSELALGYARENLAAAAEMESPTQKDRMEFFLDGEKKSLLDFEKVMPKSSAEALAERLTLKEKYENRVSDLTRWQELAKGMTAKRLTRGFPHDLVNFPKEKRRVLPGLMLYDALARILTELDGKRNLYEAIRRGVWGKGVPESDALYRKYINALYYLADGGYVDIENKNKIEKSDVEDAIRALGVTEGETVILHSSLSGVGHIEGGAKTVIDAFLSVLGENGTLMAPAFTFPYVAFEGTLLHSRVFRPFSPDNINGVRTGAIPKAMLMLYGAKRSANATHSWCAIGKNAESLLSAQKLLDDPCDTNSPMEKALEFPTRVVMFGCGVSPNTFIHYLESKVGAKYHENAVIKIKLTDGELATEVVHGHSPGCRDFYGKREPVAKFYRAAIAEGLEIKKASVGAGDVYSMKLSELYKVGMRVMRRDPDIVLCDSEECNYCKRFRGKTKKHNEEL